MRSTIVIFVAWSLCMSTAMFAEGTQPTENLIERLLESEKNIRDVQAHLSVHLLERDFPEYEFDWGYSRSKEFFQGRQNYTATENIDDNKIHNRADVHTTFNGEKMYILRADVEAVEQAGIPLHGAILALDGSNFYDVLSPNILLGFGAHEKGRLTLGQAIKQAQSYSVKKELEVIDGHPCYVVEAIGVECDPEVSDLCWDVKVWLDCKRDLRPLRFEKCYSIDGHNRWKAVNTRIDQIKLRQIDGIWFPIEGVRSHFALRRATPPEGMSKKEFYNLPLVEQSRRGVLKIEKRPYTRKVTINPETVKLNERIPDSKFIIDFPLGCKVWDNFIQLGYTVGGKDSMIRESLEDMSNVKDSLGESENNQSEHRKDKDYDISQRQEESTQEDGKLIVADPNSALPVDEHKEHCKNIYILVACGALILLAAMISVLYLRRRV